MREMTINVKDNGITYNYVNSRKIIVKNDHKAVSYKNRRLNFKSTSVSRYHLQIEQIRALCTFPKKEETTTPVGEPTTKQPESTSTAPTERETSTTLDTTISSKRIISTARLEYNTNISSTPIIRTAKSEYYTTISSTSILSTTMPEYDTTVSSTEAETTETSELDQMIEHRKNRRKRSAIDASTVKPMEVEKSQFNSSVTYTKIIFYSFGGCIIVVFVMVVFHNRAKRSQIQRCRSSVRKQRIKKYSVKKDLYETVNYA
ncbi:hypothetical protein RF11_07697 [Thelohanellus kitauei]|uniref:Uncharacterized protein n=1 Tax=Thelohanellus kitauei TaxID=669202 RepID=A0A0C2IP64_THEKT|nr:hypothetical protein RF11_07697 [Thelohanellus kitauei]